MGDSPADVEELEGDVDERGGQDAGIGGYLQTGIDYLDAIIKNGDGKTGLGGLRRAVRRTADLVRQAEQDGYKRARRELAGQQLGEEGLARLRQELREELAAESGRERSLARLGVGPESPVRQLFDNVEGDHAAYERHAALLHAAGVHWGDTDPLVREIGQQRVAAWQQAAAQGNGNVDLDPSGPVPESVRDQMIRGAVDPLHAAQAGGTPIGANGLEERLRAAAADPSKLDTDARYALASELNAELDTLSQARRGVW